MNKKNITIIILAAMIGLSAGFVYNQNSKKDGTNNINTNANVALNSVEENEAIEDIKDSLPNIDIDETIAEIKDAKFGFKLEDGMQELEFGTPWKINPSKTISLAIEGRGPEAIEEGLGIICLKKDDEVKYLFVDDESAGISPKYIEWYDEDTFLVYMVGSYGRVFTGGTLYMVDVHDMIPKSIYVAKENEEILEATQINADIISMKILEYKDENKVSVEKNIKLK